MANTRKRRRRPPTGAATAPNPAGASPERRERKEQARRAREAERKRAQRTAAIRRAAIFAGIGVLAIAIVYFTQRASSPRPIPEVAVKAAEAASCTSVQTPLSSAPGGQHLAAGASYTYTQHPATSGFHDPTPLATTPNVWPAPVRETQAVHFLEHAGVLIYYRQSGDGALPQDVVDRLASIANTTDNVAMAPYEQLPTGSALALAAWNKLQTCPPTVTAAKAGTIARGFIHAFVCTGNAPEPKASPEC
jgi:hypothetical protein